MSIRAVLFDLGHTLWDVRYNEALAPTIYRRVHRRLARAMPGPLPDAERLREAVTKHWIEEEVDVMRNKRLDQQPAADIIAEGLATLGLDVPEHVLDRITDDILSPDIWGRYLEADTLGTLRALKERGLKLGVVSNTYQRGEVLSSQLAQSGALPYIDVGVFSSEMGLRKPHPSLFEMPLAEMGVAPHEAVFVGDSPEDDIRGAQAVGMRAVLTRQYRQPAVEDVTPDRIIWRLPELIEYIDSLNSHPGLGAWLVRSWRRYLRDESRSLGRRIWEAAGFNPLVAAFLDSPGRWAIMASNLRGWPGLRRFERPSMPPCGRE